MDSISSNLHGFLKKIANNLSVPSKKFLRDSLIGLIRSGKPVVCQMARHLPNQQTKFLSRLDRLEAHLTKDSDFDNKIKAQLPAKAHDSVFPLPAIVCASGNIKSAKGIRYI